MGSTLLISGMISAVIGIILNIFTGPSGEKYGVVAYKAAYVLILMGAIALATNN